MLDIFYLVFLMLYLISFFPIIQSKITLGHDTSLGTLILDLKFKGLSWLVCDFSLQCLNFHYYSLHTKKWGIFFAATHFINDTNM